MSELSREQVDARLLDARCDFCAHDALSHGTTCIHPDCDCERGWSDCVRAAVAAMLDQARAEGAAAVVADVAGWGDEYFGCVGLPGQCGHTHHDEDAADLCATLAPYMPPGATERPVSASDARPGTVQREGEAT